MHVAFALAPCAFVVKTCSSSEYPNGSSPWHDVMAREWCSGALEECQGAPVMLTHGSEVPGIAI
eukprot:1690633-Pyramimonas_sp.AAC.1